MIETWAAILGDEPNPSSTFGQFEPRPQTDTNDMTLGTDDQNPPQSRSCTSCMARQALALVYDSPGWSLHSSAAFQGQR